MKNKKSFRRYFGTDTETPPGAPPKVDPPKTLTQAEVDAVIQKRLAEERQKVGKEQAALLERVKQLEPEAEKRAELEKQIEELQKQGLSEKQLQEMDRKKEKAKLEDERKKSEAEAARWRKTYEDEKLQRDLMDAAASKEADVVNPQQVVTLLKQGARIANRIVDGKATDQLETRVKFTAVKDNQQVEMDLTPSEALKLMKEDPNHGNLFKAGVTGGIGGGQPRGKPNTGGLLGLSQEDFNKLYAKGKLPKNLR